MCIRDSVEAFENAEYGARLNDRLAECMGQTGKWTSFVGSLGMQSHVQWAEGGAANAAKKYAKMALVDAKTESNNDATKAYEKAKELLRKHPDLKGFQGGSSAVSYTHLDVYKRQRRLWPARRTASSLLPIA